MLNIALPGVGWWVGASIAGLTTTAIGLAEGVSPEQAIVEGAVAFAMAGSINMLIGESTFGAVGDGLGASGASGTAGSAAADPTDLHSEPGGGSKADQGENYDDTSFAETTSGVDYYNTIGEDGQLNSALSSDTMGNTVIGNTLAGMADVNSVDGASTGAFYGIYHRIENLDWYKGLYNDRAETGMTKEQFQLCERGLHQGEAVGLVFAGFDALAVDAGPVVEGIATPYGIAAQESSEAALAARSSIENGASVYRQGSFGIQETTGAQFWAPENPTSSSGYAGKYGLPGGNSSGWVMKANINSSFITRSAPGLGANGGGAIEAVTNPGGASIQWFHMP